ncbi:MAG: GAF domain-containing protein [Bacteroidota bacterium]
MPATSSLPIPLDEKERLQCLLAYEILDDTREEQLDKITALVAHIFNVPGVLISIVDQKRVWVKSTYGLTIDKQERATSFCQYTIMSNQVFEMPDSLADKRFSHSSLVTQEPYIRYYCGAPLVFEKGYRLGALVLIDQVPRQLDEQQKRTLQLMAQQVVNFFELNAKSKELENEKWHLEECVVQRTKELENSISQLQQRDKKLTLSEKLLNEAQLIAKMGSWEYEVATDKFVASEALYRLLHLNSHTDTLKAIEDYFRLVHPGDVAQLREDFQHFIQTGEGNQMEYRVLLLTGDIKFILSISDLQKGVDGKVVFLRILLSVN